MLITNAFSMNMVSEFPVTISVTEICIGAVIADLHHSGVDSAVGHADTAALFSEVIGMTIPVVRRTVSLGAGDNLIVGQYSGPRLPEGTTKLPEGAMIRWLFVEIK